MVGEKVAARWRLGCGRHGVVPAAVRGLVTGPTCRACVVSASEAAGGAGVTSCRAWRDEHGKGLACELAWGVRVVLVRAQDA